VGQLVIILARVQQLYYVHRILGILDGDLVARFQDLEQGDFSDLFVRNMQVMT
jgi:hypothetical protein